MKPKTHEERRLCFLDASKVQSPLGELGGVRLCTLADEPLGTLSGVVIEPLARRIRYFVAETSGWLRRRRYLIPADCPAQVEHETQTLRVDVDPDDLVRDDTIDISSIRRYSQEDAVAAMFSTAYAS